ncbi:MAG TPA: LamG-like jellyroll fold domain-containing protein [Solirubrobacter sp.]
MHRAVLLTAVFFAVLVAPAAAGPFTSPVAPQLATSLPEGFTETTVWSGLGNPTVVRFAPGGRVFVATKAGVVYVFDSIEDPTPTVFADLSDEVQDYWDRGLLGMAIAPDGRVFVLYSHDTGWGDTCPDGGTGGLGCKIDARLSRIDADGTEHVLATGFCQQFPSHSIGTLAFGPDGYLYLSAGEGAAFDYPDFGQIGNVCGDPPNPGADIGPPESQGGALRAQAFRRPAGQAFTPDGTILRIDPDHPSLTRDDVVAYGFRNPFRFTFQPGTSQIWMGDVGWNSWEELNRVPVDGTVRNYGWPCYEGAARQDGYDALDVSTCESLYAEGSATAPYFTYDHGDHVVGGDGCAPGDSSISALSFYTGTRFPERYRGGLFFGDYGRNCIWFMPRGADGQPDPAQRELFAGDAAGPVFLTEGPDGALYYAYLDADHGDGEVRRIAYSVPTASIASSPDALEPPLEVHFDGRGSRDPDGGALTYAWDLDGDGAYDDSASATPTFTYTRRGYVTVRLRVTNPGGQSGTTSETVTVGVPPAVTIDAPTAATTWAVGDEIAFSGRAGAGTLTWAMNLRHCSRIDATQCHTHALETSTRDSGSFIAPDHDYPSYLELTATATDADGLRSSKTVRMDPRTTDVTLATSPPGLNLAFGSESLAAPFTRTVLARSAVSLNAPSPQGAFAWSSWSDGGARIHTTNVPDGGAVTYTASFSSPQPTMPSPPCICAAAPPPPKPVAAWGFDEPSGTKVPGGKLAGPLRVRGGRFGNALDFDGIDDWVTVKAPSLGTAMTVEAWVYPTRRGGSLALRETKHGASWSLYQDEVGVGATFARGAAPKLNRWTHLAMTYDGTTLRRFVNGVPAGTRAAKGALAAGAYPLRFGGNAVWKEWFKGRLDEVRVYDRALTPAQIATDMRTPITASPKKARAAKRTKGGARVKRYRGAAKPRR